jgi:hypothetical protein
MDFKRLASASTATTQSLDGAKKLVDHASEITAAHVRNSLIVFGAAVIAALSAVVIEEE